MNDSSAKEIVEFVAEALWQEDSARAANRKRLTSWSDESEDLRDKWRMMATAAISALLGHGYMIYGEPTYATLDELRGKK